MADYHPLDTRYKGPSTAYRGSAKKRADFPDKTKVAVPEPTTSQKAPTGPWGKAPPPLPVPGQSPPPIPRSAQPAPLKKRRSGRRVFIGAVVLIGIVLAVNAVNRSVNLTIQDIEDSLREMDTFDGDVSPSDQGVKL